MQNKSKLRTKEWRMHLHILGSKFIQFGVAGRVSNHLPNPTQASIRPTMSAHSDKFEYRLGFWKYSGGLRPRFF